MVKKKVVHIIVVLFSIVFLSQQCFAAESPDPLVDAKALLEQAKAYQKNKDYESAERLYQSVIGDYQGSSFALNAREKLAIVYISTERDADAQVMVDDLTAGFADVAGLPKAVYNIARAFERHEGRVDAATELYQQLIERWPDDAEAGKAGLRVARIDVLGLIASGRDSEAQEKLDSLTANFSGQEADLAQVVYDAARAYERGSGRRDVNAVSEIYRQFIERWPENRLAERARLTIARNEILLLIDAGDVSGAQAKSDELTTNFSGHADLAAVVQLIARRYEQRGEYEAARSVYREIIQRWPDSSSADKARLGIPRSELLFFINDGNDAAAQQYFGQLIADGNDMAAQQALDWLIADFNDHWYLPSVIFQIAEQYYSKARMVQSEGLEAEAEDYFRKALTIWERIITELPGSAEYTPRAYYCSAVVYSQELGEYQKGIDYYQIIVDNWPDYEYAWHAQYFVGLYCERLLKSGDITEAEALAKIEQAYIAVVENYPDSPSAKEAALKLGWMNFKKSQWINAAWYFELFLQKSPDSQTLRYVVSPLGTAYEKMGQADSAITVYREFISTADATDPLIKAITARLEELEGAKQ